MKRILAIFCSVMIIALLFSGCSTSESGSSKSKNKKASEKSEIVTYVDNVEKTDIIEMVLNTVEYTLYQNIFYNDAKGDYDGAPASKEGIFTSVTDAYNNNLQRYYVWGYNDQTKCCDWQWELKIENTKNLPPKGSLISVLGTYEVNDDALDGFWIVDPNITVEKEYTGKKTDIDMQTMSSTLERVQIINIENFPAVFEGKTVSAYGRMKNEAEMEDPYYDGSWSIAISGDYEVPAFGTSIKVTGVINNGAIGQCEIAVDYS